MNLTDADGRYIESLIDIAFIAFDVISYSINYAQGDDAGMAIDKVALGVDIACLAAPIVTGGGLAVRLAGTGTKVSVAGSKAALRGVQAGAKAGQITYSAAEIGEMWGDYKKNPDNWEQQGKPNTDKSRKYKGGKSEEATFKNKKNGKSFTRHRLIDKNGKVRHEHARGYSKQ